jgi:hypothetical protein
MHNNCSRGRPCSDGGSNIIRIGDDFVRPNRNALNELSASCHQPTFTCHLKGVVVRGEKRTCGTPPDMRSRAGLTSHDARGRRSNLPESTRAMVEPNSLGFGATVRP